MIRRWLCRLFFGSSLRRIEYRFDLVLAELVAIESCLRSYRMTTQEKLDAVGDAIDAVATQLTTSTNGIRQDILDLKNANPVVDFSRLDAKVAAVTAAAAALAALDAENPAPLAP